MDSLEYKVMILLFLAGASFAMWAYALRLGLDVIEKVQSSHPFQRRTKAKEASARAQGSKYMAEAIWNDVAKIANDYAKAGDTVSAAVVDYVIKKLEEKHPEFR